ncbi:related to monophenol monooxygenase [Fusarium fujikuroi]|nr:related to monophenol monooxygenase [Fusarium fujikuroi]SCN97744.1 related to monophenol monooxygenase [Fusarium fujikuroi]SCO45039.1 related to monophenol monooxygenase [Fusarium fujikuroi]
MISELSDLGTFNDAATLWRAAIGSPHVSSTASTHTDDQFHLDNLMASESLEDNQSLKVFGKIMQPPAAMLMGGIKKWRHLQQYLMNLASQNEVVMGALLGLDKLLEWDSMRDSSTTRHDIQDHIRDSFNTTTCAIQQDLAQVQYNSISSKMDDWLAAIFLLAWTHVLRDRAEHDSGCLFPTELAETIITCSHDWNWYSRQLLSWFNSLDSKASHMSGPTLLSSRALQVVSQYPIQIISCDYEESKYRRDSLGEDEDFQLLSQNPLSAVSEHGDSGIIVPARSPCDIKEIILRSILQPAAEWYLKTQAYCRQISSLDKHHCNRFTPDAEMKVSLEGKRIHGRLWDLWAQRPSVTSLTTAELSMSVAPDVAMRVREVSSIYLASFWILFVYLHRICWWHLPHTKAVTGALEKTWEHMKNSYGESDDRIQEKTVHPALMWPVFLFGAECKTVEHRTWAIEQLKALGKERPVLKSEAQCLENLPAFLPVTEKGSWWDETRDAGNFIDSPLLDPDTGFGGNGTGPHHCVIDGPFANTTLHIGPGQSVSDHCLSRKVNEFNSTLGNETYVHECHSKTTYLDFWETTGYTTHGAGHSGVGGVMEDIDASPGDPLFYIHHAFIDRLWWKWQSEDPDSRLYQLGGSSTQGGTEELTLDYVMTTYEIRPNVTVKERDAPSSSLRLAEDGHTVLLPQPTDDPNDPLNWSSRKKHLILLVVAWAALTSDLTSAAGSAPVILQAAEWHKSPNSVNHNNSINVLMMAIGGLIWVTMTSIIGRTPTLFWSTFLGLIFSILSSISTNFEMFMGVRAIQGLFLTSGQTIAIAFIKDIFFFHERARKIGLWALMYITFPYWGPLLANFVIGETHQWQDAFWLGVGVNGISLLLILNFMDETWYNRDLPSSVQPSRGQGFFSRLLRLTGLWQVKHHSGYFESAYDAYKRVLLIFSKPVILLVLAPYFMCFAWAIGVNISTAILFGLPQAMGGYGYSFTQLGYLHFAPIVGVFLGEIFGHFFNDHLTRRYVQKHNGVFEPEARLVTIYISIVPMIAGLVLMGQALHKHLSVAAIVVGWGMHAFGIMLTSVAVASYLLDAYPSAPAEVCGLTNVFRALSGFSVGYYQHPWGAKVGYDVSFGTQACIVAASMILIAIVHRFGHQLRLKFGQVR